MKTKTNGGKIKRGEIIQRFSDGGFIFKGYSDRFAYSHPAKETKWFDTLGGAKQWAKQPSTLEKRRE